MPFGTGKRRKSKPENKPRIERVEPTPGISLSEFEKSMSNAVNAIPAVAAAKSSFRLGNKLGTFLAKKARQMLQIPKGKGVDTQYRGVR